MKYSLIKLNEKMKGGQRFKTLCLDYVRLLVDKGKEQLSIATANGNSDWLMHKSLLNNFEIILKYLSLLV